jgi:hypothetical protein
VDPLQADPVPLERDDRHEPVDVIIAISVVAASGATWLDQASLDPVLHLAAGHADLEQVPGSQ